jgi:hypothetical protein
MLVRSPVLSLQAQSRPFMVETVDPEIARISLPNIWSTSSSAGAFANISSRSLASTTPGEGGYQVLWVHCESGIFHSRYKLTEASLSIAPRPVLVVSQAQRHRHFTRSSARVLKDFRQSSAHFSSLNRFIELLECYMTTKYNTTVTLQTGRDPPAITLLSPSSDNFKLDCTPRRLQKCYRQTFTDIVLTQSMHCSWLR